MQHLDDPAQVLELLDLLPIGRDRDQDGSDAVSKDTVGKGWRVVGVLDVQQLLHTFLGHLLDVLFVTLEELEKAADYLRFDLYDVKVQWRLKERLTYVNHCSSGHCFVAEFF